MSSHDEAPSTDAAARPGAAADVAAAPGAAADPAAAPGAAADPAAAPSTAELASDVSVAALLLTIDHDQAARVMRGLDHEQLERVTRAMNDLRDKRVDRNTIYRILVEAMHRVHGGEHALGDVPSHVESVLSRAFGDDAAGSIEGDSEKIIAKRRFAVFEALSSLDLADLLVGEHPQIAAVFIAHLDRAKAAAVVNHMPEAKRPDLVYRVATLDRTPHHVVQRVLDVMTQKVEDLGLSARRTGSKLWIKAAAEIVNRLGGGDEPILEAISEVSEDIAGSIRDQMFTFEDLRSLDKKSIQRVLSHVDTRTLVLALKATSLAVEENIFANLSKRAREIVTEEREQLGPTPISMVMEAQGAILRIVRELTGRGEIEPLCRVGEQLV